ncbi:hypothetical protein [Planktothrix agardhii]|uniref:hypothetical protein n=1 Tax=Planktothrix agardhii TaxID=1160 RepID=UPI001D0B9EBD|nr:hypothetical protein [Planktothrix agardhii]MCB8750937.1 hypothetical protein [Planktothrix agardhii 1810]
MDQFVTKPRLLLKELSYLLTYLSNASVLGVVLLTIIAIFLILVNNYSPDNLFFPRL